MGFENSFGYRGVVSRRVNISAGVDITVFAQHGLVQWNDGRPYASWRAAAEAILDRGEGHSVFLFDSGAELAQWVSEATPRN